MPMDRLTRTLAGCGLALIAAAGGCRSAHDEVPPGRAYRPGGPAQESQVGFSASPPNKSPGNYGPAYNLTQGNLGGGGLMGSNPPGGDMTGTVPGGRFGAPGTSAGLPQTGSADGTSVGSGPLSGLGQAPSLPSGGPREVPNYLNGFPTQPPAAGSMGSPGQPPSPL
jgi:hypothetical protein